MLILNHIAIAQQTEKIPGFAKDQRPMSWYKQQIKLNEAILQKIQKMKVHGSMTLKRHELFYDMIQQTSAMQM